jgi:hypothetical protein
MKQVFLPSDLSFNGPMSAEADFLASLFAADSPFPWEPLSLEGDAYLQGLETELDADPTFEADFDKAITDGWNQTSALLAAQWQSLGAVPPQSLLDALKAQFQSRMPDDALSTIAAAATQWVNSGRPVAEQLVEVVQTLLPDWDTGDLTVLARPLAYSLRDGRGEVLDITLRSAPQTDWNSLSKIEKARLSLAIASVALHKAKDMS